MVSQAFRFLGAKSAGGVSLRIAIDQKDSRLAGGKRRRQVDSGSCFPYPAFLISNRDDFSQGDSEPRVNLACFT